MTDIQYSEICELLTKKFGSTLVDRLERSTGVEYELLIKQDPNDLLLRILNDIYVHYVLPFEMGIEIKKILAENFDTMNFSIALSEKQDLNIGTQIESAKDLVTSFYNMTEKLGFGKEILNEQYREGEE